MAYRHILRAVMAARGRCVTQTAITFAVRRPITLGIFRTPIRTFSSGDYLRTMNSGLLDQLL